MNRQWQFFRPGWREGIADSNNIYYIDELNAFSGNAPNKLTGTSYLLMCAGDPSPEIFSIVKQEYDAIMPYVGLKPGGELLVPGVYGESDIKNTDALVRAEQLGRDGVMTGQACFRK